MNDDTIGVQGELLETLALLQQRESDLELAGQMGDAVCRENVAMKERLRELARELDGARESEVDARREATTADERLQAEERTSTMLRTRLSDCRAKIHSLEIEASASASTPRSMSRAIDTARVMKERDLLRREHHRATSMVEDLSLQALRAEESSADGERRVADAKQAAQRAAQRNAVLERRVEELAGTIVEAEARAAESDKRRRKQQRARRALEKELERLQAAERAGGELVAQLEMRNARLGQELDEVLAARAREARIRVGSGSEASPLSSPRTSRSGSALCLGSPMGSWSNLLGDGERSASQRSATEDGAEGDEGETLANELADIGVDIDVGDEFDDEAALMAAFADEEFAEAETNAEVEAAAAAAAHEPRADGDNAPASAVSTESPTPRFRGNWAPTIHARVPQSFLPPKATVAEIAAEKARKKAKKAKKKAAAAAAAAAMVRIAAAAEAAAEEEHAAAEAAEARTEEEPAVAVAEAEPVAGGVAAGVAVKPAAAESGAPFVGDAGSASSAPPERAADAACPSDDGEDESDGDVCESSDPDLPQSPPQRPKAPGPPLPKRTLVSQQIDLMFFHFTCTMTTIKVELSRSKAMQDDIAREYYNALGERQMYNEATADGIPFTEWPGWIRSRYTSLYVQALSEAQEKRRLAQLALAARQGDAPPGPSPVQRLFGFFRRGPGDAAKGGRGGRRKL